MLVVGAVAIMELLFVLSSVRQPSYLQPASTGAYMDALNSTLGFHRVYATYDDISDSLGQTHRTAGHKENLEAIAKLLDIDIRFVKVTKSEKAAALPRQRGFMTNAS
ncbi:hypothetical protein GGH13_009820, partial [Coemansia sp. S155-1]